MNVLKKKEEFKEVFYKILRKHVMTLLQEKSINRNQTLTKNDEIGKNERFSRKLFQAKFLLSPIVSRDLVNNIKGFSGEEGWYNLLLMSNT